VPRQRILSGVGHLGPEWLEAGFHLGLNSIVVLILPTSASRSEPVRDYHGGYLAVDSGADYTDTESPHYLNYYRRTVAHNSVLVTIRQKVFSVEQLWPAATTAVSAWIRRVIENRAQPRRLSQHARSLDLGSMRVVDLCRAIHYARAMPAMPTLARKLKTFTAKLVCAAQDLLFVFDRVVSTHPEFKRRGCCTA